MLYFIVECFLGFSGSRGSQHTNPCSAEFGDLVCRMLEKGSCSHSCT